MVPSWTKFLDFIQVILTSVQKLKKESAKSWLICGWNQSSILELGMTVHHPQHHLLLHHRLPLLFQQRRVNGPTLRRNLVNFLNTRLSQIPLQHMEMDSDWVTKQCSSMGLKGPLTISIWQEVFHIENWKFERRYNFLTYTLTITAAWSINYIVQSFQDHIV